MINIIRSHKLFFLNAFKYGFPKFSQINNNSVYVCISNDDQPVGLRRNVLH